MAGGEGTRLKPLTAILPKPLIPVNNKPMLEHIIENFNLFNFKKFNLIVNHQSELIKSFFKSLKKNYKILFTKEKKPLGTAGSLGLLPKLDSKKPIIIMNADQNECLCGSDSTSEEMESDICVEHALGCIWLDEYCISLNFSK